MKTIAFCGIDGAGKTTQLTQISENLANCGYKTCVTKIQHVPFYKYESEIITQYEIRVHMAFEFADYYIHRIRELEHENCDFMLCDRHALCQLAFAMTYGINKKQRQVLEEIFAIPGQPDITFYFDVPLDVALNRIHARAKPARVHETKEILGPTLQNYKTLIHSDRFSNTVCIDAEKNANQQTLILMEHIKPLMM